MDAAAYASGASWLAEDQRTDARNIVEALGNLLYLISVDAENAALVRSYVGQAEERLRALQVLLPEPTPARPQNKGLKIVGVPNSFHGD
jgi:hypothetical protein